MCSCCQTASEQIASITEPSAQLSSASVSQRLPECECEDGSIFFHAAFPLLPFINGPHHISSHLITALQYRAASCRLALGPGTTLRSQLPSALAGRVWPICLFRFGYQIDR